ncbi:hypothetical protein PIB30_000358 [Stylosanthes scabra]|uniref:Uncharacterized protein n=1 Tax=Stylosanthes scabra TaxID=79078 RepID=A0ABU6U160_9FABA|nr:hypothetical protein [Stylosanthes scabra]
MWMALTKLALSSQQLLKKQQAGVSVQSYRLGQISNFHRVRIAKRWTGGTPMVDSHLMLSMQLKCISSLPFTFIIIYLDDNAPWNKMFRYSTLEYVNSFHILKN